MTAKGQYLRRGCGPLVLVRLSSKAAVGERFCSWITEQLAAMGGGKGGYQGAFTFGIGLARFRWTDESPAL
jgi:hypothetical protein